MPDPHLHPALALPKQGRTDVLRIVPLGVLRAAVTGLAAVSE
jgi:hypothetical protein